MAFKDDLIKARSYIVFIAGLLCAFVMVYYIEKNSVIPTNPRPPVMMVKTVIKPTDNSVHVATPDPVVSEHDAVSAPVAPVPVTSPVQVADPVAVVQTQTATSVPVVAAGRASETMMADASMLPKTPGSIAPVTKVAGKPYKRELTAQEKEWAKIAWQYFANNTQATTGMVNSVSGYPAATIWDTASYMMAAISAERLHVIDRNEFDRRMTTLLTSLAKIPLFDNKLPNKSYNTKSLAMVSYSNQESAKGIGWSAIDICRMLVPLRILQQRYPSHAAGVKQVLARWQMGELVHDGLMFGGVVDDHGALSVLQEGRLGYEQYAAKALALFGHQAKAALNYTNSIAYVDIYGTKVGIDSRDPKTSGAYNYTLSEPYLLDGLEFGFDANSKELAARLFTAQEARFRQTGKLTAVTEDHIDSAPYFVYNTVYVAGRTWATITDKGQDASAFRSLSTKAAFGWQALYNNDYSGKLLAAVSGLNVPDQGWYAGVYEQSGKANKSVNANTNAVVLESLAYIKFGKLL